jgi:hypothetical protein
LVEHPAYDIFNQEPVLSTALDTRMRAIADEVGFPIRLTVEEAEEVIRILWEFVGHMGADVGEHGYEFHLIERARHWAAQLQIAMLAAIAHAGPRLIERAEQNGKAANPM